MISLPLVSVIIPTHNSENSISEALLSVFHQTYKNIEIIVIDDSSTDKTQQIVAKLKKDSPFVLYFFVVSPCFASFSRNYGLQHAHGQYFAFLDSDDVWYDQKLEYQISVMEEYSIDFFSCQNTFSRKYNPKVKIKSSRPVLVSLKMNLIKNRFHTSNVVLRKSIPFKFNPLQKYGEDFFLWNKILSTKKYKCCYSKSVVSYYRNFSGKTGLANNYYQAYLGELFSVNYLFKEHDISFFFYLFICFFLYLKFLIRMITKKRIFANKSLS